MFHKSTRACKNKALADAYTIGVLLRTLQSGPLFFFPLPPPPAPSSPRIRFIYVHSCCGVQVDGMIATIGTSVVVGGPGAASEPSTRALQATRDAAVVVNSMLKPGTKSTDIVKAIAAVAAVSTRQRCDFICVHEIRGHCWVVLLPSPPYPISAPSCRQQATVFMYADVFYVCRRVQF